ncbi:MAG: addiction module protein [Aliidongia sp.]
MLAIDFSHLTTEQRLDRIDALCESIDRDALPLTAAQAQELDHRIAMLDQSPGEGRDAFEILAEMRQRFG